MVSKTEVRIAVVALVAFAVASAVQRHIIKVPVVGAYLPQ